MLRTLTVVLLAISVPAHATESGFVEPNETVLIKIRADNQRAVVTTNRDFEQRDNDQLNKLLDSRDEVNKGADQYMQHAASVGLNVPDEMLATGKDWIAAAEAGMHKIEQAKMEKAYGDNKPIVFVSFSMPDQLILQYMHEANKYDAMVVLRGLYKSDLNATLKKIGELVNRDASLKGLSIDPTLYSRFGINAVPAFVLPTEKLARCVSVDCPIPAFVKAGGDISIEYFLRQVRALGDRNESSIADSILLVAESK